MARRLQPCTWCERPPSTLDPTNLLLQPDAYRLNETAAGAALRSAQAEPAHVARTDGEPEELVLIPRCAPQAPAWTARALHGLEDPDGSGLLGDEDGTIGRDGGSGHAAQVLCEDLLD